MNYCNYIFYNVKRNIKEVMSSNASFWFKIAASILKHLMFVLAWKPFYDTFHSIQGWEFSHHLLLIGFLTIGTGVVEVFFDGLRELPRMIDSGKLDSYLLFPQNTVLTFALSKTSITSWSDIITGFILIAVSGKFEPIVLILMILSPMFFFSLYLYLGSLRFFIPNGSSLIYDIYSKTLLLAGQPNISYSGILKLITQSLLPVCLVSLYPIHYLIHKNIQTLCIIIIGNLFFMFFSFLLFDKGLRRYESSTSRIQGGL